jgi:hypothetical protein
MSALGHKRTFRNVATMSALPRKADIGPRMTGKSIFKIAAVRTQNFLGTAVLRRSIPELRASTDALKSLHRIDIGAAIADVDRRQKGRSERAKNQP